MSIRNIRINHIDNPFAVDTKNNNFSFNADEKGPFNVTLYKEGKAIESKMIELKDSISFSFEGDLEYDSDYELTIKGESESSLKFETTSVLDSMMIKANDVFAPRMFKNVKLGGNIKKARMYITGLGLYRLSINGKRIGEDYLTPGYNDYDAYLRYQAYDVKDALEENNLIEVFLGDGWYKGRFGLDKPAGKDDKVFGSEYRLCLKMVVEYENGEKEMVRSDESFEYTDSYCVKSGILDGDSYDYSKTLIEAKHCLKDEKAYNLIPDLGTRVKKHDVLTPELYISPKGEQILDFKQNMVGFVSFTMKLEKGQKVTIKHGEVLQDECFYNANLRTAKSESNYIGDGTARTFEPMFTFHGFRYALVEGIEKVDPNMFKGVVIYSDIRKTIDVKTSNKKINQLMSNTFWGQRGNFVDVPTDCPQRDERLGWTADTQVFVNTACYQMDTYNFYRKYMMDLRADQTMYFNGDIPMYSPSLKHEAGGGGAVWADAGTIIPWNVYMAYGDKKLLESNFPMIDEYVMTLIEKDKAQGDRGLITEGFTFGDWLAQDGVCAQSMMGGTDNAYIMSVYYYYSINIARKAAEVIGLTEKAEYYREFEKKIYDAILSEYFAPNGKLALDTQTSYVLSLTYGIYRDKERVIKDFKERLRKDLYRMKTGFTGTPLILPCLFDNGMEDDAYRILFNEECPGWIYAINLGATTIWERWNSLLPDGRISGITMNSLNHYALGSVCEAIYSRIMGLRNIEPGFRKVEIKPYLNYRLKSASISYESISGTYNVSWRIENGKCHLNIDIPFGCEASVSLYSINENVGCGHYEYEVEVPRNIEYPFSLVSPNLDVISTEEGRQAMQKHIPQAFYMISENDEFKVSNGYFVRYMAMFGASKEAMDAYEEEINNIRL